MLNLVLKNVVATFKETFDLHVLKYRDFSWSLAKTCASHLFCIQAI